MCIRASTTPDSSHLIVQPAGWASPKGYANGVLASGRQLFVGGQIGWNAQCQFDSDDLVDQVRQALCNCLAVVEAAGGRPEHIVRMTWYVTSKREYLDASAQIGRIFRTTIGSFSIAMTAVEVSALIEDRAKVEIEVTAVVPE